jgi:hypothetical protein
VTAGQSKALSERLQRHGGTKAAEAFQRFAPISCPFSCISYTSSSRHSLTCLRRSPKIFSTMIGQTISHYRIIDPAVNTISEESLDKDARSFVVMRLSCRLWFEFRAESDWQLAIHP